MSQISERGFPIEPADSPREAPRVIGYTLLPDELAAAMAYVSLNSQRMRRRFYIGASLMALALILGGALVAALFGERFNPGAHDLARVNVIAGLIIWAILTSPLWTGSGSPETQRKALLRHYKELARQPSRQRVLGPHEFEFSDRGVVTRSSNIVTTIQWSAIESVVTDQSGILLDLGASEFIVIPRRVFENNGTFAEFDRVVREAWEAGKSAGRAAGEIPIAGRYESPSR
jgi:MFS family permease